MGEQERRNVVRYRATRSVLDRGAELALILEKRDALSQSIGVRRRLSWLVQALADGCIPEAHGQVLALEESLSMSARRVGVCAQVVALGAALERLRRELKPEGCGWHGLRMPVRAMGDWTTADWKAPG